MPHNWFEVMLRISCARRPGPDGLLADQVALTGGGVTRMVDRMVAPDSVERVPCASDRRVVYAGLTPEGHAVLDKAVSIHDDNLRRMLADFTDASSSSSTSSCDASGARGSPPESPPPRRFRMPLSRSAAYACLGGWPGMTGPVG